MAQQVEGLGSMARTAEYGDGAEREKAGEMGVPAPSRERA